MVDPDDRTAALGAAATLHARAFPYLDRAAATRDVIETANELLAWILGPTSMSLTLGDAVEQPTTPPIGEPAVQLHDTEQVDVTVHTRDAKGFETPDEIVWSVDDETVCTLTGTADGDSKTATIVAGNPGSTVVHVTDGALTATLAVDVVPGGTATISIAEGAPVEQPPAPVV